MTTNEQMTELEQRTVNGYGYINIDGLRVRVRVLDTRKAFGRTDAHITPESGSGAKWIDITRIERE